LHGGKDGIVCHARREYARKISLPPAFREYNLKTKGESFMAKSQDRGKKEAKKPKKNKK
jgi:hypothetical protein